MATPTYKIPMPGNIKKPPMIIMLREDHTFLHKENQKEIEKIAQAAGVEMNKTARIHERRGRRAVQGMGLKELDKLLKRIKETSDPEDVVIQMSIATGYANAMCQFGLMSDEELKEVIEVIEQAGKMAIHRIMNARHSIWSRIIGKSAHS